MALPILRYEKFELQFGVYCAGTKVGDALITQVHRVQSLEKQSSGNRTLRDRFYFTPFSTLIAFNFI